ncbi:ribosome recycling factor [Periconia macrospinosa]|uniref:Ribosome recycling factor n=1 Tax=Periconia macrospinosa TaxID=97972 RepID=A0A2V1D6A8_9PLEO|nr:ribosome recycling factor [Periconia macrospinosa]
MAFSNLPRVASRISPQYIIPRTARAIAPPCHNFIAQTRNPQTSFPSHQPFSTSSFLQKKAGKANKANARSDSSPPVSNPGPSTSTDDAFDFETLESQILKAIEKLTHDLAQLRGGGRLRPEVVENLTVHLGTAGKDGKGKESVKLRDIAQVIPRGKVLNVVCGEAEHIKPVSSAIAASNHSLTPLAPESSNPLTIQVPLPPPTGDSRRQAIDTATRLSMEADRSIQAARQTHNKNLRKMSLDRTILPDDLQKASRKMQEVVKRGHTEVKRITEGAKKVLEAL